MPKEEASIGCYSLQTKIHILILILIFGGQKRENQKKQKRSDRQYLKPLPKSRIDRTIDGSEVFRYNERKWKTKERVGGDIMTKQRTRKSKLVYSFVKIDYCRVEIPLASAFPTLISVEN